MKTQREIANQIRKIQKDYQHVLIGELSNIQVNAPRALMQLEAEAMLIALNWCLGKQYKSNLKRCE